MYYRNDNQKILGPERAINYFFSTLPCPTIQNDVLQMKKRKLVFISFFAIIDISN